MKRVTVTLLFVLASILAKAEVLDTSSYELSSVTQEIRKTAIAAAKPRLTKSDWLVKLDR